MSLVVGCDPSAKKIALVAMDTVTKTFLTRAYVLYKTGKQSPESMARALGYMEEFCSELSNVSRHDRFAWVEDPLVGKGGVRSTMVQAYIGGIIRGTLCRSGFTVYGANQSTWKKQVCNNGHAQKPDVERVVKVAWPKVHPYVEHDGDLTDAAAISLYGQQILARSAALAARSSL